MGMHLDTAFFPRLLDLEDRTGIRSEDALKIFAAESGLDSTAKNPIGCVGLNQFCSGTLQSWFKGDGTKDYASLAAQFRNLPASKQLDSIEGLWTSRKNAAMKGEIPDATDLYWLNFLPATFVLAAPPDHRIAPDGLRALGWSDQAILGTMAANAAFLTRDDVNGIGPIASKNVGANANAKWVIRVDGLTKWLEDNPNTPLYEAALPLLATARAERPIGPPPPAPIPPVPMPPDPSPAPPPTTPAAVGGVTFTQGAIAGIVLAILAAIAAAFAHK